MYPDFSGVTDSGNGLGDMIPTYNPPLDIPNNGNGGPAVPFSQQSNDGDNAESPKPSDGSQHGGQPGQQQDPNAQRDAFFQQRYDKLVSSLAKRGISIDPNADTYEEVLNPVFQSHEYMEAIKNDPNLLLEVASQMFPDRFVRPNYIEMVKQELDKEFGPDFHPDKDESAVFGTKSYEYNLRANMLAMEIKQKEMLMQQQEAFQREKAQMEKQQQIAQEISQISTKYGIQEEEARNAIELLKDPKIWTTELLVNVGRLINGSLKIDYNHYKNNLNNNKEQHGGMPPSPANLGGFVPSRDRDFDEFLGY